MSDHPAVQRCKDRCRLAGCDTDLDAAIDALAAALTADAAAKARDLIRERDACNERLQELRTARAVNRAQDEQTFAGLYDLRRADKAAYDALLERHRRLLRAVESYADARFDDCAQPNPARRPWLEVCHAATDCHAAGDAAPAATTPAPAPAPLPAEVQRVVDAAREWRKAFRGEHPQSREYWEWNSELASAVDALPPAPAATPAPQVGERRIAEGREWEYRRPGNGNSQTVVTADASDRGIERYFDRQTWQSLPLAPAPAPATPPDPRAGIVPPAGCRLLPVRLRDGVLNVRTDEEHARGLDLDGWPRHPDWRGFAYPPTPAHPQGLVCGAPILYRARDGYYCTSAAAHDVAVQPVAVAVVG